MCRSEWHGISRHQPNAGCASRLVATSRRAPYHRLILTQARAAPSPYPHSGARRTIALSSLRRASHRRQRLSRFASRLIPTQAPRAAAPAAPARPVRQLPSGRLGGPLGGCRVASLYTAASSQSSQSDGFKPRLVRRGAWRDVLSEGRLAEAEAWRDAVAEASAAIRSEACWLKPRPERLAGAGGSASGGVASPRLLRPLLLTYGPKG